MGWPSRMPANGERESISALVSSRISFEVPSAGSLPGALVKWFIAAVGVGGLADMLLREKEQVPASAVSAVGAFDGRGDVRDSGSC